MLAALAALSGVPRPGRRREAATAAFVRRPQIAGRAANSLPVVAGDVDLRCCPRTKAYVARRTAEGNSSREIRRCLKRYIARELYRALNTSTALTAQPSTAPAAA